MTFYVTNQNVVVLVLLVFGAVFGVFRDIVLVSRRFVKTGRIVSFFEDLFGCVLFTFIYHITVFVTNYGYVRWYEIASVLAGFVFYRTFFSDIFVKLLCIIGEIVKRIMEALLKPITFLLCIMGKTAIRLWRMLACKGLRVYSLMLRKRYLDIAKNGF